MPEQMTRLECPECPWVSSAEKASRDDGSLMTDYRRHVDRKHRPEPRRVTWMPEEDEA